VAIDIREIKRRRRVSKEQQPFSEHLSTRLTEESLQDETLRLVERLSSSLDELRIKQGDEPISEELSQALRLLKEKL